MKKRLLIPLLIIFILRPFPTFPKIVEYIKVGYIDLDKIISIYTTKYLDTEIKLIEDNISLLRLTYDTSYYNLTEKEKNVFQYNLQNQKSKLMNLKSNRHFWNISGEIVDDVIFEKIQRDIMEAIYRTSILEGYSLILDNTENFIYGSDDINLTDKVLFRLDEKLLNLLNNEIN